MAEVKSDHEHLDGSPRPTRKRRCMGHCKRFWWAYLLALICIVVLVVCLVIFVGVPKIAQSKIDDAKLDIQGVNVFETESESYLMQINSTIRTDGSIHADVDPFVGEMYLEDAEGQRPFATLNFPKTSAKKYQEVNISQSINITDMDAFREFNIWFHNNETLRVTIYGKTKVKPSGLDRKYGVTFKKTLDIKGLNVFSGTEVTEGKIALKKDDDGNNFEGKAKIPNASHFSLDIGNVTFTNFVGDKEYGSLYIQNLLLLPGDNHVDIKGNMDQVGILGLVRSQEYCQTGIIPFKLLGKAVENHGQDLSYFAAALGSTNQTVDINIGQIIKDSIHADVGCAKS